MIYSVIVLFNLQGNHPWWGCLSETSNETLKDTGIFLMGEAQVCCDLRHVVDKPGIPPSTTPPHFPTPSPQIHTPGSNPSHAFSIFDFRCEPITTNANSTMSQSAEFEANKCNHSRLVLVLLLIGWESGARVLLNHLRQSIENRASMKRASTFRSQFTLVTSSWKR